MSAPRLKIVSPSKKLSLRDIPKVELHRHLDLTFRVSTLRELAAAAGLKPPASEEDFAREYLIREPLSDLSAMLERFLIPQRVLGSEAALERLAFEAVEDAAAEGIRILELRYDPYFIAMGHANLSWDKIHASILRGLARARAAAPTVAVGLICIVRRSIPLRDAEAVVRFAIDHRESFVALDLADDEERYDSVPFAHAFEKARAAGLRVTVHAGEANYAGAARAVIDAVDRLGASRIGHGVQIWRSEQALEFIKSRRIPLELCPTSNWLTRAVPALEAHPFVGLMNEGVRVTINADDPGVFGIDLVNEYRILSEMHGLDTDDFTRINDVAAAASFIPFREKQAVWPRAIDNGLVGG